MAWSKIDEGASYIPSGSSSTTVTFNVALAQNDIVIAVFGDDDGLGVADFLSSGWSTLHSNAGVDPGRLVMYKRMGATPDTSFSFDQDGQVRTAYLWQVWRGADTTTAIDATATTATGASGLPDAPSYTPVTNGALVFAVGIQDDDDASSGLTAPTGYTNLLASDTAQASTSVGATVMIASKELATAAAENPAAFTGGSGNDAWAAITFALRPAASSTNTLLANDVSSGTPTVGTPAIGQVHILAANDVASGTPTVSAPALGTDGTDALLAEDISSGVPTVGTPALGQVHALLAESVSAGVPSVSSPALASTAASTATSSGGYGTTWNTKTLSRIAREARRAKSPRKARPIIIRAIGTALGGTDEARAAAAEAANEALTSAPITQDTVAEVYALAERILARQDEEDAEMLLLSAA